MNEETINHVLFLCPHALATWKCSGLLLHDIQSAELEQNIATLFTLLKRQDTATQICKLSLWVIWYIWKSGNKVLFAKWNLHPMEDARRALDENDE